MNRGKMEKERLDSFRKVAKSALENPFKDININNSYLALPLMKQNQTPVPQHSKNIAT